MNPSAQPEQVLSYLLEHPDFLVNHPELLTHVTLPPAYGGRTVSLVERQVELLRDKCKAFERRLAELVRIGQENDAIAEKLQHWNRELLRVRDPQVLPPVMIEQLQAGFSLPQVALRLWRLGAPGAHLAANWVLEDAAVMALADGFKKPYCGPNADFAVAAWLPGAGAETRSVALLPLRVGLAPDSFGLLVLGSPDPDRFQASMGTAFLERIAENASAALSRLLD